MDQRRPTLGRFLRMAIFGLWIAQSGCQAHSPQADPGPSVAEFDVATDLLLAHYDCKTDVDDLHSVAAFATILASSEFGALRHHAVAGAYGIQEGLYAPPNEVFDLAFGENWSDAHSNPERALGEVLGLAIETIRTGGDVWVAEAGQSDFTARVVQSLKDAAPDFDAGARFHVVQHADWNEEVTSPDALRFVKENARYHKIPDGNAAGNGTAWFRTEDARDWKGLIADSALVSVWDLALSTGNRYNGRDGRYVNNAIARGGVDFSDTAEIVWILGLPNDLGVMEFFERFGGR